MAFDVLHVGNESVMHHTYKERRKLLEDLQINGPHWCTPPVYEDGKALFAATARMGLEGVVAKRLNSLYKPGVRSAAWIKTKHMRVETFALLGWIPPTERRSVDRGGVVVGFLSGDRVEYAGIVESGYGEDLVNRLPHLSRDEWDRLRGGDEPSEPPSLTAMVRFLEWSPAGGLRHASIRSFASTKGLDAFHKEAM